MPTSLLAERLLPYLLLAAFFIVSAIFRPILPIDETRYLAVAWEMFSRQDFLVPTLNFEPYFHKPPLLFWLIDLASMLLPWILSPHLWRSRPWQRWQAGIDIPLRDQRVIRLLALWPLAVLAAFSLIAGKQPHYLVPALPPVILLLGYFMARIPLGALKVTAAAMLAAAGIAQAVGSVTVLPRFDMTAAASLSRQDQTPIWLSRDVIRAS
ncbi:hypothetical protein [Mesorhizobium sp.]|uniref:ArnT family glycosyltransferase n=1 Tax=Mesorhizobium sp. TaxID=1871066 RepID=UPI00120BF960|nr:hypothetical protein [Mesorhizobium sp.]TIM05057.1 MAG: hypothetical protein E5Y62_29175 [Mesorhizobium sp.]